MENGEQEWIVWGMAWVALRHWRCGRAEGDTARAWFFECLDAQRRGRHLTPDLERLEAELLARLGPCPSAAIPSAEASAEMPKFGPVA
jgi:hypothetical protein